MENILFTILCVFGIIVLYKKITGVIMENNKLTALLNTALANQQRKRIDKTYDYSDYTVRFSHNNEVLTAKIINLLTEPSEYVEGVGVVNKPAKVITEEFLQHYYNDDKIVVISEPHLDRLCRCSSELLEASCELV